MARGVRREIEDYDEDEVVVRGKTKREADVFYDEDDQQSDVRPNYYRMPNDTEVFLITDYLTFNAGNSVKYIVRSCRTDGVTKGNRAQDLLKSGMYLTRELSLALDKLSDDDPLWDDVNEFLRAVKNLYK